MCNIIDNTKPYEMKQGQITQFTQGYLHKGIHELLQGTDLLTSTFGANVIVAHTH